MKEATRKMLLKLVADNFRNLALAEQVKDRTTVSWPLSEEINKRVETADRELKILELGCGEGDLADSLPKAGVDYLGLDSCRELITKAQERYADQAKRRFVPLDLLKLNELTEIGFDYVLASNVLHHIPSLKLRLEALKQLKNKVAPGGKIYLSVKNFRDDPAGRKQLWKFTILKMIGKHSMDWGDIITDSRDSHGKLLGQVYYHAWSKKELKQLTTQAGLRIERLNVSDDKLEAILIR